MKSKNAKWLDRMAEINLFITIIATPYFFYKGFMDLDAEINININILIGLGILMSGLTLFFLLETVVDIYNKLDNRF